MSPPRATFADGVPGTADAERHRTARVEKRVIPDHGEATYRGSGRLLDRAALVTGGTADALSQASGARRSRIGPGATPFRATADERPWRASGPDVAASRGRQRRAHEHGEQAGHRHGEQRADDAGDVESREQSDR
jgi:hypothetical protein